MPRSHFLCQAIFHNAGLAMGVPTPAENMLKSRNRVAARFFCVCDFIEAGRNRLISLISGVDSVSHVNRRSLAFA